MKCPKCGYTSFDYLNECKKCGTDISDVRSMLGIIAISPENMALAKPTASAAPPEPAHDELDFSHANLLSDVDTGEEQESGLHGDFVTDFAAESEPEEDTADNALVEHTSYSSEQEPPPPPPKPQAKAAAKAEPFAFGQGNDGTLTITGMGEEDEEAAPSDDFLDMDFSEVFGEEKKK